MRVRLSNGRWQAWHSFRAFPHAASRRWFFHVSFSSEPSLSWIFKRMIRIFLLLSLTCFPAIHATGLAEPSTLPVWRPQWHASVVISDSASISPPKVATFISISYNNTSPQTDLMITSFGEVLYNSQSNAMVFSLRQSGSGRRFREVIANSTVSSIDGPTGIIFNNY